MRRKLDVRRIVREYESGSAIQHIADAYDASYGTIRRLLLREKVTIRPHGGQNARDRRKPDDVESDRAHAPRNTV
ncbi:MULTISPECIES: hypothetical protein [Amycolatopsis]|uniref:helix-turn-helix domain-containing protein n=1 Tax=Amycolatopsis TaxID=1813 RepID=UPI0007DFF9CB|nr:MULTISPECIES: hypothetical protein [Amycolatopsis]OAP20390.1 hypothetical protein A4R44_08814 [Amycolatopsis sp. M39]